MANSDFKPIFRILVLRADVEPFVGTVQELADQNKDALGFLPSQVYSQAAAEEKLLIACIETSDGRIYCGHLMFGRVFPTAKIFQLFVDTAYRGRNAATALVSALVAQLESIGYRSISARVAKDLPANNFWDKAGFEFVKTVPGGASTNREINIRVRELETPSLFRPVVASSLPPDLHLIEQLSIKAPIFAIDLNVLFDVTEDRERSDFASRLINASFQNVIRLSVAQEFINELQRKQQSSNDPVLKLVEQLPRLPSPTDADLKRLLAELQLIVFPSRQTLSVNDKSDLLHIATAIHNRITGFVTSDKRLLRGRNAILAKFGVELLSVVDFADLFERFEPSELVPVKALIKGEQLTARSVASEDVQIRQFLKTNQVPDQVITELTKPRSGPGSGHQFGVFDVDKPIAFLSWQSTGGLNLQTEMFCVADDSHNCIRQAIEGLFVEAAKDASRAGPALLRLRHSTGSITNEVALEQGFRSSASATPSSLQKIAIGSAVMASNWDSTRAKLRNISGIDLPASIPQFNNHSQKIIVQTPDGGTVALPLSDLETLLSPVLICLPGRGCAIVPMRKKYANELFLTSQQQSFLASREAVFLRERVYFSSPTTLHALKQFSPILFYESKQGGGSGRVIAAARITATWLFPKTDISSDLVRKGVLDEETLAEITSKDLIAATSFDNILFLRKPIGLKRLREIGCVDGANLVTARRLSGEVFANVLSEGDFRGSL